MSRLFFIIALIVLSFTPVIAEEQVKETYKLQGQVEYDDNPVETIYLDENIDKPKVNIPQRSVTIPIRVLNITSNTNTPRSALARATIARNNLKDILPLSGSLSESAHGITYGTLWGEEVTSLSQLESTTGIFLRYDSPKCFSLDTTFKQSANQDIGTQYGTVRVTPEWHITDKLTLKNTFTNYVNAPKNKNEVTLVYKPALKKYAESLKFELGVAESYYSNGSRSSAVSFSTGFKL